jgi:hypothetical protein
MVAILAGLGLLSSSCFYPEKSYLGYQAPSDLTRPVVHDYKYFIAMQYYAGFWNRRLKVYVTPNMISVAEIGGALTAPMFMDKRWNDQEFYVNPALEKRYQKIDPESKEFLSVNKANFQLRRSEVVNVIYNQQRMFSMGGIPHSGRVVLTTKQGPQYEFILLGIQDGHRIVEWLLSDREDQPGTTSH